MSAASVSKYSVEHVYALVHSINQSKNDPTSDPTDLSIRMLLVQELQQLFDATYKVVHHDDHDALTESLNDLDSADTKKLFKLWSLLRVPHPELLPLYSTNKGVITFPSENIPHAVEIMTTHMEYITNSIKACPLYNLWVNGDQLWIDTISFYQGFTFTQVMGPLGTSSAGGGMAGTGLASSKPGKEERTSKLIKTLMSSTVDGQIVLGKSYTRFLESMRMMLRLSSGLLSDDLAKRILATSDATKILALRAELTLLDFSDTLYDQLSIVVYKWINAKDVVASHLMTLARGSFDQGTTLEGIPLLQRILRYHDSSGIELSMMDGNGQDRHLHALSLLSGMKILEGLEKKAAMSIVSQAIIDAIKPVIEASVFNFEQTNPGDDVKVGTTIHPASIKALSCCLREIGLEEVSRAIITDIERKVINLDFYEAAQLAKLLMKDMDRDEWEARILSIKSFKGEPVDQLLVLFGRDPVHEGIKTLKNGNKDCHHCSKPGHFKKDCPMLKGVASGGQVSAFVDITFTCTECRRSVTFEAGEQRFYARMGFDPKNKVRCKPCSDARKGKKMVASQSAPPNAPAQNNAPTHTVPVENGASDAEKKKKEE